MSVSPKLRWNVLVRDEFTCQYCGAKAPSVRLEVDHLIPRSKGGKDLFTNLVTACEECNRGKSDQELAYQDHMLKNDLAYVLGNYEENPALALKLIQRARKDALDRLMEGMDAAWSFTIWDAARLTPTSNFELYLLAAFYDQEDIHRAMATVADEIRAGKFPKNLDRILTRVGQYAEMFNKEFYGVDTKENTDA